MEARSYPQMPLPPKVSVLPRLEGGDTELLLGSLCCWFGMNSGAWGWRSEKFGLDLYPARCWEEVGNRSVVGGG